MDNFLVKSFSEIDLADKFFDPLKIDYPEFTEWFNKKAVAGETATVYLENGRIKDFLYMKLESEEITTTGNCRIVPSLPQRNRLKIGTFKVESRGTRRGERLIKRALDFAIDKNAEEVYVTVFPKHTKLIELFAKYGFTEQARKYHSDDNYELILVKSLSSFTGNILSDYPFVHTANVNKYLLSIYPKYHTLLFPDSILNNESYEIIKDLSHTNSIHKAYICFMQDAANLKRGDNVVIYRTTDIPGKAFYRSVVTSICVVEKVMSKSDFLSVDDFIGQVKDYSIFEERDLRTWYKKPNIYLIELTYNVSLNKRITRGDLIGNIGLDANAYWGILKLTDAQYNGIRTKGMADESYFIDQA